MTSGWCSCTASSAASPSLTPTTSWPSAASSFRNSDADALGVVGDEDAAASRRGCCDPNSITTNVLQRSTNRAFARLARSGIALVQSMPFELTVERAAADAEQPRGDRLVAAHLLQRADDVLALDLDERRRAHSPRDVLEAAPTAVPQRGISRCSCMLPARSRFA